MPVVGEEVASATGLASLARVISLVGELGNGALGVYDTVSNPKSAIVNMFGLLFGVGAVAKAARDGRGLAEIAALRRTLSPETISAMGKIFKEKNDILQVVLAVCRR